MINPLGCFTSSLNRVFGPDSTWWKAKATCKNCVSSQFSPHSTMATAKGTSHDSDHIHMAREMSNPKAGEWGSWGAQKKMNQTTCPVLTTLFPYVSCFFLRGWRGRLWHIVLMCPFRLYLSLALQILWQRHSRLLKNRHKWKMVGRRSNQNHVDIVLSRGVS